MPFCSFFLVPHAFVFVSFYSSYYNTYYYFVKDTQKLVPRSDKP